VNYIALTLANYFELEAKFFIVCKINKSNQQLLLDIRESGGELRTDLSSVDVDSGRLRSTCFVVLL
jgi:hypothetical protein